MKNALSFEKLKTALINPPVLEYPDFSPSNTFILTTDASGYAIGAVLSNSNNKPIAYASRTLNPAEIKYPTIHKELLSITWAVNHFRPYLYGRKFKICTDHCPLIYLFGMNVHNVPGQYTPYEPIFGKKSVLRSNILNNFDPIYNFESYINELKFRLRIAWKDAKDNLVESKIKRKAIADKKSCNITYKFNDKVLLKKETGNKLEPLFEGPYKVISDKAPNIELKMNNKIVLVQKNRVKKYYDK